MTRWGKEDCRQCLVWRSGDCNKGDFGYVALIGGSVRYSGATKLANMAAAAMLSGAGVVKLAVPREIADATMPYLLESTLFPLASDNGALRFESNELEELTSNVNTVAIGMGCGLSDGVKNTLRYLLKSFCGTLIVDADGINCIAQMGVDVFKNCTPRVILTPHVKEFSRLLGIAVEDVKINGAELAKRFAEKFGVIVLLKGAATVVTDGIRTVYVERGCAGMATAGSGDVLSGIIAAICAYNQSKPLQAAATAAYINGLAGELAEAASNPISMIASDTVRQIPQAITLVLSEK